MNVVALMGNVATKPEIRTTTGDKAVCTFRLALQRPGGDQADFVTVVAWERQAEICAQYLEVGRRVAIEGRLHHSTWEAGEQKRSRVEIVASRIELVGGRRRQEPADGEAAPAAASEGSEPTGASFEDVPQQAPILVAT